jgi:hypothetical protein
MTSGYGSISRDRQSGNRNGKLALAKPLTPPAIRHK